MSSDFENSRLKSWSALIHEQKVANRFPKEFLFGVGSLASQFKREWNSDGEGPSIWNEYAHSYPEIIHNHQTGDTTINSDEYFMDDIAAVKHLNVSSSKMNLNMNYYAQ